MSERLSIRELRYKQNPERKRKRERPNVAAQNLIAGSAYSDESIGKCAKTIRQIATALSTSSSGRRREHADDELVPKK